ncbi:MOP flippase family protein [Pedobacter hiemivivus]|uniref:MOP flippase family protein n=1 Tax=Pedobacter hiemivivus TaxID=2530454 RepID=A0A4U1G662_9SPHI|nr:MOP flippase family protein [Pedobacter hiemivivus]TKC59267.1 MOP flippase family protein [Pedobacter hiemivivus]
MSFSKLAINSGKWVTLSTIIQTGIQFAQIAILARFLDSSDFGIVAMSNVFIAFFLTFADLGFSNSIIHKQETDQRILSTVYYVNILLGVSMFIIVYFASPLVVAFYNEPRLSKVINVTAFIFLFIYLGSIPAILLKKELRFKSIAIIDITGNAVGFLLMIFLAYKGYKELSIVYGGLVTHAIRTILEIYYGRHLFTPKLHFKIKEIKAHLKFGMFNLGETFVGFVQSNWDNIIIGKILGPKYLGIYTLAMQLGYYPISKLNPLILQVAYPLIAKIKDDEAILKRTYLKILDILSYFNYPLLAGLYITVESVVPLVYGPGWSETFPLVRIFIFVSAFSCLAHPLFTIAYSKGKPNYLFYLSIVTLVIKIPLVFVLGKYWHITGVAIGILITNIISLILNFKMVNYLIGDFIEEFLKNIIKPIFFCLIMVFVIYIYKSLIGYEGIYHTVTQVLIGGVIYISLTLKYKYSLKDILEVRKSL